MLNVRLLFLFNMISLVFAGAVNAQFEVVEKSQSGIVLAWSVPDVTFDNLSTPDGDYIVPACSDLPHLAEPGYPMLPVNSLLLRNVSPSQVTIMDTVYTSRSTATICPAPGYHQMDDEIITRYALGPVYKRNAFYPASFVDATTGTQRDDHLQRLAVYPVKVNPVSGHIRVLRYIKLFIKGAVQTGPGNATFSGTNIKPSFIPSDRVLQDVSPWWQGHTGTRLVRLATTKDGVYGVSGRQLQDYGININNISLRTLKLVKRGDEQPLRILGDGNDILDPDERILFYAQRLQGDSTWYHTWSDTNVYWLTWGGNDGQRYLSANMEAPAAPYPSNYASHIHIEQDLEYYHGDTDLDIQESLNTPGEGWVWSKSFYPGTSETFTFDLPGLSGDDDVTAEFTVKLRGMTSDAATPDHHVICKINDVTVYDGYFNDRQQWQPTFTVNPDILLPAGNRLQIQSVNDTQAEISQFYLDWFKATYARNFAAQNNVLSIDASALPALTTASAYGFTSDSIYAWDVATNREISAPVIQPGQYLDIKILSAGAKDGNYALFYVNSASVFQGTRGINLVVLDETSGQVDWTRNFDTWASAADADSLVAVINRIPAGRIVLCAVRDEGSNQLQEAQLNAIESLGSIRIRDLGTQGSWAMLAVKGQGSAIAEALTAAGSGPVQVNEKLLIAGNGEQFIANVSVPESSQGPLVVFSLDGVRTPNIRALEPPDLFSPANGADYLIITHAKFAEQAYQLANYRAAHNGFRTQVVDIEDIYTAFSFGIKEAPAIKSFLAYTRQHWSAPAQQYVLLMGDASWDPKFNAPSTTKYDYVPVYGNPVSDIWYVCLDGEEDILPDMYIGRLPVSTVEQADWALDKIMTYESTPSAGWKKDFLFISGGFDQYEQLVFNEQSAKLGEDFVQPPPAGGRVSFIKKEVQGLDEAGKRDDILAALDKGVLWTNFIGHAGSSTWDLMFHNPDIELLANGPRYPFISSMTCHTGRFAEPNQDSFGERFLLVPEKGAIAFWGTAGWGYTYEDYLFLRQLYPIVLQDTVRHIGQAISRARTGLWDLMGDGPHVRNLILQYTLMGDPALSLALPEKPDLAITADDIRVQPAIPSEADSTASVQVHIHNYGLVTTDSVDVIIRAEKRGAADVNATYINHLGPQVFHDSLQVIWDLRDMTGLVDLSASLDPDDVILEADESNNQASKPVTVVSNVLRILHPHNNAMLEPGNISLSVRNPRVANIDDFMFEFQLDSTSVFNSPFLTTSPAISPGVLATKWLVMNVKPGLYFWRCRNLAETDGGVWLTGSFRVRENEDYGWQQNHPAQFGSNQLTGTDTSSSGAVLGEQPVLFDVESAGIQDGNFGRILINSVSPIEADRGINMVVYDAIADSIVLTRTFDTYADETSPDSLYAVIERMTEGLYVLCAIKDEGSNQLNETAYKALEAIGSTHCRQLDYRSSWGIIGAKGAAIGSVPEGYSDTGAGHVALQKTLDLYQRSGNMSSGMIGPATRWNIAELIADTPEGTDITFDVIGVRAVNGQDTLYNDIQKRKIDLSSINPHMYPYLVLVANLYTLDSRRTPRVTSWKLTYEPAPDPAILPDALIAEPDSFLSGTPVTMSARLYNIGLVPVQKDSLVIRFAQAPVNGAASTIEDITITQSIQPDSFITVTEAWQSSAIVGKRELRLVIDPDEQYIDLDRTNNASSAIVNVTADTTAPQMRVTFDGDEIMYGDWVSATPIIRIDITDNSQVSLLDTTRIAIFMDDTRVPFGGPSTPLQIQDQGNSGGALHIQYTPQLSDGEHALIVQAPDGSGNATTFQENFVVATDLALRDVLNYPNPFTDHTEITFQMSQAADVRIKIYTVAGRLIQDLSPGWLPAGYNIIPWDGRDADGDLPANGVYLYKVLANSGSKKTNAMGKCIIMN